MTKLEFMKELESLLSDIPLEEREEALRYYNGYFEDAGEDHEEEIINELGSPSKVASIIKADLNSNADDLENRGYFTENGYQDTVFKDERNEIVRSGNKNAGNKQADGSNAANNFDQTNNTNNSNNAYGTNQAGNANHTYDNNGNKEPNYNQGAGQAVYQNAQQKNTNTGLIVLIILTSLFWAPPVFGILISIVATLFGLIVGFGAAGIAMMIGGIALIVAGLMQLGLPLMALLFCGCGMLVLGLGMLFVLACVAICKHVVPALFKGVVNLCRIPFKNRSVMA